MLKRIFLLLHVFTCVYAHSQGVIKGRVVEEDGKTPIKFALVRLTQNDSLIKGMVTDRGGFFAFSSVPIGVYDVEIKDFSYSSHKIERIKMETKDTLKDIGVIKLVALTIEEAIRAKDVVPIEVKPLEVKPVEVTVVELPFIEIKEDPNSYPMIKGRVVEEDGKTSIVFAVVRFMKGDTIIAGNITDEHGLFLLNPIPPGKYDMRITCAGYKDHKEEVEIGRGLFKEIPDVKLITSKEKEIIIKADRPAFESDPVVKVRKVKSSKKVKKYRDNNNN